MLDPVPTKFVRSLGVDYVIAVDLAGAATPEPLPPRGPYLLDVLRLSTGLMHARLTEHSRAGANLILRPSATTGPVPGVRDYAKARGWRGLGREAVDAAWPELCRHLPWLAGRHRGVRAAL